MKTIKAILVLILCLNLGYANASGHKTIEEIEKSHKNPPSFKYHYDAGSMIFSVLGYWENGKGIVYSFSGDELTEKREFTNYQEFKNFLQPSTPKLNKYIIVALK